jgi:2'-5' RNA ligase
MMIGLRLPAEMGKVLSSILVPSDATRVDYGHGHVTVTILESEDEADILRAAQAIRPVLRGFEPIHCKAERVECFPEGADGVPIIVMLDAPKLHELKKAVDAALDDAGIAYKKKYPQYLPHTTVAYGKTPIEPFKATALEWVAYDLVLWGGDTRDQGIGITMPFNLARRVARRFASQQSQACSILRVC